MNRESIPYEQALELRELGFNGQCFAWYHPDKHLDVWSIHTNGDMEVPLEASAPLYQQAFRWFREKHNILSTIYANASGFLYEWQDAIGGTHRGWSEYEGPNDSGCWDTYEEAEIACLNKLIEIVKNK